MIQLILSLFWIHVKETYKDLEPPLTALYPTFSMLPWQIEKAFDSLYKEWRAFIGIQIGSYALL
jgi:hypothetical protein